ncbi:MAG TPA: zinc ribbon domain-containing protein [Iamia sp.]
MPCGEGSRRSTSFLDVDDVAAGYVTRQRWADGSTWVRGPVDAHPALVDQDLWDTVAARIAEQSSRARPSTRSPRTTSVPYVLRGLLHCGLCDRKMVGTTAHQTIRYRCLASQTRALPAYLADHPKSLYVREDQVVAALDRWLPSLADPDFLAASQDTGTDDDQRASLQRRIDDIDQATRNLLRAIEQGTDPTVVQPRIAELRDDRVALVSDLSTIEAPDGRLTSDDIAALLDELGGMETVLAEAEPRDKAAIYASLGLRLTYQPDKRVVVATADLDRVLSRVGGGT